MGEEFRLSFVHSYDSQKEYIGLISRKPGYFWLGFFELDVATSTLTLKQVVTEIAPINTSANSCTSCAISGNKNDSMMYIGASFEDGVDYFNEFLVYNTDTLD